MQTTTCSKYSIFRLSQISQQMLALESLKLFGLERWKIFRRPTLHKIEVETAVHRGPTLTALNTSLTKF